jgi:hypothetical protein
MIYLRKANNDLISHCQCADGYISSPGQMDCPWCGCGWLFICAACHKAFTFAEAVEVDFTLDQMARRDLKYWKARRMPPSAEDIQIWVDFMNVLLDGIEVGRQYVYLDSFLIPTDADVITFQGLHCAHDLAVVPQVEALRDPSIMRDLLSNPQYWDETALPSDESEPA